MPRTRKPTRVHMDPKTGDWRIFFSSGKRKRLGLRGPNAREAAEEALKEELLIEALGSNAPRSTDRTPVVDVLYRYALAKEDVVEQPHLIADAIAALSPFWGAKTVAEINRDNCKAYTKWRMEGGLRRHQIATDGNSFSKASISRSTARRDLTTLKAALKLAHDDGVLSGLIPTVVLPAETPPRDRVLTRDEAAAILWELWRGAPSKARDGSQHRSPGKTRHAARMFFLLLYTGSRFGTIAKATRKKTSDGPWVDMANQIWFRRGANENATTKRREPHRIPGKIYLALERWERLFPDQKYIVERPSRPGHPIGDIGQALEGACTRLGLERITAHTLKHSAITLYISGGGDPVAASEYFSTSYATISKNYLHLHPDYQDVALGTVAQLGKRQK